MLYTTLLSLLSFNSASAQTPSNLASITTCPTRPVFVTANNQRSTETAGVSNQLMDITGGLTGNMILRVMRPNAMTSSNLVETKASPAGIRSACFTYAAPSTGFTKTTNSSIGIAGCAVDTYNIPISSYFGTTSASAINCGRTKIAADTYLGYFNIQADAKNTSANNVKEMTQLNALVNPLVFQVTIPTTLTYRTTPEIMVPPVGIVKSYVPSVIFTKTNTTGSDGNITISTEITLIDSYQSQAGSLNWTSTLPVVLPVGNYFPTNPYPTWNAKTCTLLVNGVVRCETVASFNNFCQPNGGLQAIKTGQGFYKENFRILCPTGDAACTAGDPLPFSLEFTIGSNLDNEICGAVGIKVTTNLGAVYKYDLTRVTALTPTWNSTLVAVPLSDPLKLNSAITYAGYIDSPFDLSALTITSVKMTCGANCVVPRTFEFIPTASGYSAAAATANSFKFLTNPTLDQWVIGLTPRMYTVDFEGDNTKSPDNYFYNYRSFSFGASKTSETWVLEVTTTLSYSISQLNSLTKRSEGQEMSKTFKIPVGILPEQGKSASKNDGFRMMNVAAPAAALAMGLALL